MVCGEALIDLTPISHGNTEAYTARVGGSPYNVSITLARLGAPVNFLGKLSQDFFGRTLQQQLVANGVDTSYLVLGTEPSPLAFVHLDNSTLEPEFHFYGQGTADCSLKPEELPVTLDPSIKALHFGSFSLVREPTSSLLAGLMQQAAESHFITLDPNIRPTMIGDRESYLVRLRGWLEVTDVVKVSQADLAWLHPGADPEIIAQSWLEAGPILIVITQGSQGSIALTRSQRVVVPAYPTTVVDTVGAGDAFMGGLLAYWYQQNMLERTKLAELKAEVLKESLQYASITAALNCARAGADPPTRSEVLSVLNHL